MTPVAAIIVRMLPVLFVTLAAAFYVVHIEGRDAYALRNVVPMVLLAVVSLVTLYRGGGMWAGRGWRWPLGAIGFAVPALGLSLYLHYGYSIDLDGMVSESVYPREVFRYLPVYTVFAGAVGFAIGWIVGRNMDPRESARTVHCSVFTTRSFC